MYCSRIVLNNTLLLAPRTSHPRPLRPADLAQNPQRPLHSMAPNRGKPPGLVASDGAPRWWEDRTANPFDHRAKANKMIAIQSEVWCKR